MLKLMLVCLGGAIGAGSRFLVCNLFASCPSTFWGTLVVNIIGCLLLGFIAYFSLNKIANIDPNILLLLTVGVFGGFTTFSTYSMESFSMLMEGKHLESLSYLFLSPLLGVFATFCGFALAKNLIH